MEVARHGRPRSRYRDAVGWQQARAEIYDGSGTQFDPAVIAAYDTIGDDRFARLGEGVSLALEGGRLR